MSETQKEIIITRLKGLVNILEATQGNELPESTEALIAVREVQLSMNNLANHIHATAESNQHQH